MDNKDVIIEQLRAELAAVDMILNVVGSDAAFREELLRSTKARLLNAERERDARPDITPEDARLVRVICVRPTVDSVTAAARVDEALLAHARKAVVK